ncbi:multiple monosaccharide ABC transporter permease [Aureimonas phyllosphaerae]|uniref:Xylose transport system permease protein XylH n=1 Tax=Aureimonas phyllosphaerae TaxID=1166078 RepID=A0A7W6BRI4_9HYPH|nr:multiple monosaccharide ABC transporter permease [Aureimonas phyllosphaerae]MBB3934970.1 putative multiple sugar transport system permease protein [Aureimonas phyllosphaerae]MBB3958978.1 putative multiple sugar transport system permease protein [Aureimonas phyllosphaerae]SFF40185.1 multiple monosaccharide ABC transporter membrane protein [Aureimonas phyllosphaerae]
MSIKTVEAPGGQGGGASLDYFKNNLREYGMLVALVAIILFFAAYSAATGRPTFVSASNLTNLFLQNSYVIIMAIGMLLIIITGHIDLSVGSVVGFVGAVGAVLMVLYDIPVPIAVVMCLVVGAVIGAIQGYFVAFLRIPSFIVTLAGMLVFRGLTFMTLGSSSSISPIPASLRAISTGTIPDILPVMGLANSTTLILAIVLAVGFAMFAVTKRSARSRVGPVAEPQAFFYGRVALVTVAILFMGYLLATNRGLPNVLILMAVLIAIYAFVTSRTTIGRRVYAVGGNEKAAKLSGVKTERIVFLAFVNMGVLAAIAGLVFFARVGSATAKNGTGLELDVIAACFIGGASAYGGVGKVTGAVIGAFIMGALNMGMQTSMQLSIDYQQLVKGLVLLAAVCFDVYNRNKA